MTRTIADDFGMARQFVRHSCGMCHTSILGIKGEGLPKTWGTIGGLPVCPQHLAELRTEYAAQLDVNDTQAHLATAIHEVEELCK